MGGKILSYILTMGTTLRDREGESFVSTKSNLYSASVYVYLYAISYCYHIVIMAPDCIWLNTMVQI